MSKQEILDIEEESGHHIGELIEEFQDRASKPKGTEEKKDSKNIIVALAEKDLKKRYDDFKRQQLKMGKTDPIDFDK